MFIFIPEYVTDILGDTLLIFMVVLIPATAFALYRFLQNSVGLFKDDYLERKIDKMEKQQDEMKQKVDILFNRFLKDDSKSRKG